VKSVRLMHLISIEKQSLFWTIAFGHLENRVSSGIAERVSITVASRTGNLRTFVSSPPLGFQQKQLR